MSDKKESIEDLLEVPEKNTKAPAGFVKTHTGEVIPVGKAAALPVTPQGDTEEESTDEAEADS